MLTLPADRTGARPPKRSKPDPLSIADAEAPFACEGGFVVPNKRARRAATRKRIADGVWRVAGVFLVQVWRVSGARQGTGSRRGSLHPPRRQGAFRPLQPRPYAQPAHRPTLKAPCGTRMDYLRSRLPPRSASLRVVAALRFDGRGGKRPSRHCPGTCKTHLIATPMHPRQALRVKVRPELPGNFPLRGNFPASSDLFPLTRAAEGVRARQAVRRRAGHGARAAPMPERHSHGRRTTRKVPK